MTLERYTFQVKYKHSLPPPPYIFIVNRLNYIIIYVTEYRNSIPMDLNIIPGPYKFNKHATVGYHGLPLTCDITLLLSVEKHFIAVILELLNLISMTPIINQQYIFIVRIDRGMSLTKMWRVIADRLLWCCRICLSNEYRSRDRRRNPWVGQYVSYWWSIVWFRNIRLYMICTRMCSWDGLWWIALSRHRLSYTGC